MPAEQIVALERQPCRLRGGRAGAEAAQAGRAASGPTGDALGNREAAPGGALTVARSATPSLNGGARPRPFRDDARGNLLRVRRPVGQVAASARSALRRPQLDQEAPVPGQRAQLVAFVRAGDGRRLAAGDRPCRHPAEGVGCADWPRWPGAGHRAGPALQERPANEPRSPPRARHMSRPLECPALRTAVGPASRSPPLAAPRSPHVVPERRQQHMLRSLWRAHCALASSLPARRPPARWNAQAVRRRTQAQAAYRTYRRGATRRTCPKARR